LKVRSDGISGLYSPVIFHGADIELILTNGADDHLGLEQTAFSDVKYGQWREQGAAGA
jgi:hypothetical protein